MHGLNTIGLLDPAIHYKHCNPDPDQTTLSILGMLRKSPAAHRSFRKSLTLDSHKCFDMPRCAASCSNRCNCDLYSTLRKLKILALLVQNQNKTRSLQWSFAKSTPDEPQIKGFVGTGYYSSPYSDRTNALSGLR